MKNKKNVYITSAIICLFIISIMAGARLYTGYMDNEKETVNNLTAEVIEENIGDVIFDYPYFKSSDFEKMQNKRFIGTYIFHSTGRNYKPGEPDENMITHQEVANKCGEIAKYLYGYTYRQNTPAFVEFMDVYNGGNFYMYLSIDEGDPNSATNVVNIIMDSMSGQVRYLDSRTNSLKINNPEFNKDYKQELTSDIKTKLTENTKRDLKLMGYDGDITVDNFTVSTIADADEGYLCYVFEATIDNADTRIVTYATSDNEVFIIEGING